MGHVKASEAPRTVGGEAAVDEVLRSRERWVGLVVNTFFDLRTPRKPASRMCDSTWSRPITYSCLAHQGMHLPAPIDAVVLRMKASDLSEPGNRHAAAARTASCPQQRDSRMRSGILSLPGEEPGRGARPAKRSRCSVMNQIISSRGGLAPSRNICSRPSQSRRPSAAQRSPAG